MPQTVPGRSNAVKDEQRPLVIISRAEARRRVGNISRSTEYRLRDGDPDWPVPVGRGYLEVEIQNYIARLAERRS
jgi:hypothetical protein